LVIKNKKEKGMHNNILFTKEIQHNEELASKNAKIVALETEHQISTRDKNMTILNLRN
jgi:hypothetical protein